MSEDVHAHRAGFRLLLAGNPNYFGTFPDIGFEPVLPLKGDTTYEALSCVSYSPERGRLEATIQVRRPAGYSSGLCGRGSYEHVRFHVSYDEGATFIDAGLVSVNVHDLPAGRDCVKNPWHPLSYVCGVDFQPRRDWCGRPVLPLVRAILSWELVPDAGKPNWPVIWGDVRECHVQVRPRRFVLSDIADKVPKDLLEQIPHAVLEEPPDVQPDAGPLPEPTLETLAKNYRSSEIPEHRFALSHLLAAAEAPALTSAALAGSAALGKSLGIDLGKVAAALEATKGDVTFEELHCVGLDNNLDQLVATFTVKRPTGFSGGPCTRGSTEYIAFWADFGGDCVYTYLGTAQVNTHDYDKLPKGGLCYAAVLPVDLGAFRRGCDVPIFGRVRAVLSWGTPPSTSNPDALPHWGNRIDAHVQLRPGRRYDGVARFDFVGGVPAVDLNPLTGMTAVATTLDVNGTPVAPDSPFAGLVVLRGVPDPALAGERYLIWMSNLTTGGPAAPLTQQFYVNPADGPGTWHTPDPSGTLWPTWANNPSGVLGYFTPGGNDKWRLDLELIGSGIVDSQTVQMDNLVRGVIDPSDPDNAGDLRLDTGSACRVPRGTLTGQFVARDLHFSHWSISVHGGPDTPVPPTPLAVGIAPTTQTDLAGQPFSLNTSNLKACGYTIRVTVVDRAVVNSAHVGNRVNIERGVCLE